MKTRNEHARALRHRATGAGVAVAVDTRPKATRILKGRGSYDRRRDRGTDD